MARLNLDKEVIFGLCCKLQIALRAPSGAWHHHIFGKCPMGQGSALHTILACGLATPLE